MPTIRVYHYGTLSPDADGVTRVDPSRFGAKRHTAAEVRAGGPPRGFFYTSPDAKEGIFDHAKRRYYADVDETALYDAVSDPERLLATHGAIGMMHEAQRRGYRGVRYPFDPLPPVVAMWHPQEVKEDMSYSPPKPPQSKLLFSRVPEMPAWTKSIGEMPTDRVRRGALADRLEETDSHHDDATLHTLRHHEGEVHLVAHPVTKKIAALTFRPVGLEELNAARRGRYVPLPHGSEIVNGPGGTHAVVPHMVGASQNGFSVGQVYDEGESASRWTQHPTATPEEARAIAVSRAFPEPVKLARRAPAGGIVANNLFSKGGRFIANPLARVSGVMQRLRARVQLSRATAGNAELQAIAAEYRAKHGLTHSPPHLAAWSRPHAEHMARVYDDLVSDPHDPHVRAAYAALNAEIEQQHDALIAHGYSAEYTHDDPYPHSAAMMEDLAKRRRIKVFKTPEGHHPLMTPEESDRFRFVHDVFGHAMHGHQFGPRGEDNAYRDHASMFSPLARHAMATETRGQNSWVNAGPHSHLPVTERPFAPQKVALWPVELQGEYHEMPVKLARPHAIHPDAFPFEAADAGRFQPATHKKIDSAVEAAIADKPKLLPSVSEVKGLAHFGGAVRGGYADAGAMMHHMLPHPKDAMRWAAANAILSPEEGWVNHTEGAAHALALWHGAGRPTDAATLHHLLGGTGKPNVFWDGLPAPGLPAAYTAGRRLAPPKYGKDKAKKLVGLFSIPDDEFHFDPRLVASGSYKVPNFFAAHLDARGVPIDTHMAKLLRVSKKDIGKGTLLDAQKRLVGTPWVTHAYKALVSHAAREMGWEPRQVQEAAWTAVTAIMLAKKRGATGDFASIASKLHDRAIRAGWDMHTVFQSPTFVEALRALGVDDAKQAEAVAASRARLPVPGKTTPSSPLPAAVESAAERLPADKVRAAYPIDEALRLSRTEVHRNLDALIHLALLATLS